MTIAPTFKHILVAEDNDFNQEVAIELLTEAGYLVTAKDNGQLLIQELLSQPKDRYHLILMDLEMPILDGHQATTEIRKNPMFDHIPIIALTSHTLEAKKLQCAQEGMQDFVSKPFDPPILYQTLDKWLKQNHVMSFNTASTSVHSQLKLTRECDFKTINTTRGLQLSGNNPSLYLKLLKRFADTQTTTLIQLRNCPQADLCSQDFKRLLHTLKGVSATIGAEHLATSIGQFEIFLEAVTNQAPDKEVATDFLNNITNLLDLNIQELFMYFEAQDVAPTSPESIATDAADAIQFIAPLLSLLESSNADAVDFFQSNATKYRHILKEEDFVALTNAIDEYEFDLAISLLKP